MKAALIVGGAVRIVLFRSGPIVIIVAPIDSHFERLVNEIEMIAPNCFPAVQYAMFSTMSQSEKTYASVQGILSEKLSCFAFSGMESLFRLSLIHI